MYEGSYREKRTLTWEDGSDGGGGCGRDDDDDDDDAGLGAPWAGDSGKWGGKECQGVRITLRQVISRWVHSDR